MQIHLVNLAHQPSVAFKSYLVLCTLNIISPQLKEGLLSIPVTKGSSQNAEQAELIFRLHSSLSPGNI